MKRFLKHLRLPENTEVLFMLMLGIVLQVTDGSPFTIRKRCAIVWDTVLPAENFSQFIQRCIKTILSGIVVIRCLTTYVYVVSAMLVIFSIIKDVAPRLMLLWLLIAGVKSICMTFVEALTGVYVCSAFGKIRKACVEFFISKALEIIFAAYLWASVLSIYQKMEMRRAESRKPKNWEEFYKQIDFKRPRTRSLLDESTLCKTARLNSFEFKDVPQIILQMLRREEEMSQDSLLGSGMMLASVSNFGSYDDLKTSQSLGELGLLDLKTVQVKGIEEDENLSPADKALKFLKMNWDDVRKAQEMKKTCEKRSLSVDSDTWNQVTISHGNLKKPTQTRPEIVLKEISLFKFEEENELVKKKSGGKKKSLDLKLGFSLFSFLREKDELRTRDEEQLSTAYNLDEDEEDGEEDGGTTTPLFMSNIKEEVAVNRIRLNFVSRKLKANAYSKLYKEEYMSVIGPEVFDKATRLPKVLPPMSFTMGTRASTSLPAFLEAGSRSKKKIIFDGKSAERIEGVESVRSWNNSEEVKDSLREYDYSDPEFDYGEDSNDRKSSYIIGEEDLEEYENCDEAAETESVEEIKNYCDSREMMKKHNLECESLQKIPIFTSREAETEEIVAIPEECFHEENEVQEREEIKEEFCFRKRKIKIRIRGKRIQRLQAAPQVNFSPKGGQRNRDEDGDDSPSKFGGKKDSEESKRPPRYNRKGKRSTEDLWTGGFCKERERPKSSNRKQVYLLTQLLQRSFVDLSAGQCNSKGKNEGRQALHDFLESKETDLKNYFKSFAHRRNGRDSPDPNDSEKNKKRNKIWKSKVLETAAIYNPEIENEFPASEKRVSDYLTNLVFNALTKNLINRENRSSPRKDEESSFDLDRFVLCKSQNFPSPNQKFFSSGKSDVSLEAEDCFRDDFPFDSNENRSKILNSVFPVCEIGKKKAERERSNSRLIRRWINSAFFEESRINRPDPDGNPGMKISLEKDSSKSSDLIVGEPEDPLPKESVTKKMVDFATNPDENLNEEDRGCDRPDSEESFSLYYSKAADLASPLLDMKRFIYPDHIHYSYKHVKKKGFDVDINGKLPLLVRESLTMNDPIGLKTVTEDPKNPESKIVRRPMDLSFASTNAFAEWQTDPWGVPGEKLEEKISEEENCPAGGQIEREKKSPDSEVRKEKKAKRGKKSKKENRQENFSRGVEILKKHSKSSRSQSRDLDDFMKMYSPKDYFLIEKLIKIYWRLNHGNRNSSKSEEASKSERPPVKISSSQLHSNKGRINSTCNPAIFLNENKTRSEKKKMESREERTKDMFARLEREILLQSKIQQKSFASAGAGQQI